MIRVVVSRYSCLLISEPEPYFTYSFGYWSFLERLIACLQSVYDRGTWAKIVGILITIVDPSIWIIEKVEKYRVIIPRKIVWKLDRTSWSKKSNQTRMEVIGWDSESIPRLTTFSKTNSGPFSSYTVYAYGLGSSAQGRVDISLEKNEALKLQ